MNTSLPARLRGRGGLLLTQAALLVFCAVCAVPASATALQPRPLAELVHEADTIVIGHARAAESVWVGRNLYTRYHVEVQETLLGTPAYEVVVLVEGGVDMNRKHPIAMAVVDAPVLMQGEQMALLLKRGSAIGDVAHHIVGFNQGRISLELPAGPIDATRGDVAADSAARARRLTQLRTRLQQAIAERGNPTLQTAPSLGRPDAARQGQRRGPNGLVR